MMRPPPGHARSLLSAKGRQWQEIDVDEQPGRREEMIERSGRTSVPQIWIGERHVGGYDDLAALESAGELEKTLIVVSGDHGAPGFPNGKCNLYDFGTAVPLAVRWPGTGKPGRVVDDFVNITDLAPTFLDAAGVAIPEVMTGRSLRPVVDSGKSGLVEPKRTWVMCAGKL